MNGQKKEAELLTSEEKREIDTTSRDLRRESLAFRMCIGKKLGARSFSEDYYAKTFFSGLTKYSGKEWFTRWQQTVPSEVRNFLAGRENTTVAILEAGSPDWRVLYFHVVGPEGINEVDSRRILSEYAFILPAQGEVLRRLTQETDAETLRTLPFTMLHAGMRFIASEKDTKYFDGSITGPKGTWKKEGQITPNSAMLLDIPRGITKVVRDITKTEFSTRFENPEILLRTLRDSKVSAKGVRGREGALLMQSYWKYE